jgi:hypothetical protein
VGGLTDDELPGHTTDVPPGDQGGGGLAEGDPVGQVEAELELGGDLDPLEVLLEVPNDVVVGLEGREDVYEVEEAGFERRVGHGPLQHALAPPRHVEDAGLLTGPEVRDPARKIRDLIVQRGHGSADFLWYGPQHEGHSISAGMPSWTS